MKKYKTYKNSGVEWIGEIPEEWSVVPLKHYLSLKGRIGWKGLKSEEFQENSYAYLVTGQDFNSDVVNWNRCYQINKERYDEDPFIQLENGDVLVTKDGTIGKVAKVVDLDKPACLNSGIFVVKQKKNVFEQNYLYWVLVSNQLKEFVGFNSSGSTIAHLYQNVFENMPLTVPSMSEQQAIASYLDNKVGQIDASVSAINAQIEDLKAYRQSIISEAVTKGLNPNVPMKDSGVEWIGEIPEGWEIKKIKNVCSVTDGTHFSPQTSTEGKPYVTVSNVNYDKIDIEGALLISEDDFANLVKQGCQPSIGDVLLSKDGTVGRSAVVKENNDFVCLSSLGILSPKSFLDSDFLKMSLDSILMQGQMLKAMAGSALRRITITKINEFVIVTPPLNEQKGIVSYLDTKTSMIDATIASLESQRDDLSALKQSVISEAVTGKIDVREWNKKQN